MTNTSQRVAIVTGANTGIGLVTARELSRQGFHVILACRNEAKTQAAIASIREQVPNANLEFLPLDLGDFASIRRSAASFLARDLPLHLLVNNAGLGGGKGVTASGFEQAFGTNHMGHFLFTFLLLERLQKSAPARIVTVASRAHTRVKGIDFARLRESGRSSLGIGEYCVSKLANVLFNAELAQRLEGSGVNCYALHPGVVASDIWRKVPWPLNRLLTARMLSTEDGARTSIYCATSPEVATETGLYYDKCQAVRTSRAGADMALAKRLWQFSQENISS
jgi:retinol dehydrogenase 12